MLFAIYFSPLTPIKFHNKVFVQYFLSIKSLFHGMKEPQAQKTPYFYESGVTISLATWKAAISELS